MIFCIVNYFSPGLFHSVSTSVPDGVLLISNRDIKKKQEIGVGSFGKVYQAEWKSQRCDVALKELHLQKWGNVSDLDFKTEVKVLNELEHPNVVRLLGVCIEPGHYSLIIEYMGLGSLYQMLRKENEKLDWPTRFSLVSQAAASIDYLHSLKPPILHRDIKSTNFLLSGSKSAMILKICDFGLAKTRDETKRETGSIKGIVGSLPWTAPEILRMGHHTFESDVYSLGMVYWEIVTYEIPYYYQSEDNIRAFVTSRQRLEIPRESPCLLSKIIRRCWEHNPEDRPTCADIFDMLCKWTHISISLGQTNRSKYSHWIMKYYVKIRKFPDFNAFVVRYFAKMTTSLIVQQNQVHPARFPSLAVAHSFEKNLLD